jgi:two-component system, NtrC family, response regulator HydG
MKTTRQTPTLPRDHLPVAPDPVVDKVRFPDMADLMARLHFSTSDGRIWMDDQRMLLVHATALGSLRREMIEALGVEVTRGLLTRMGYHAGACDAQMARKVRPATTLKDMFVVGPQMHCLEGIGLSEAVRLDFDVERGTHYGEFIWTSATEDEEHARHFAIGTEPMCWMQIGYASGFSTEFMGRPVLYREVECQSMGQPACRIVGRTVEEWGDEAAQDMRYLKAEIFAAGLATPDGERPYMSAPATALAPQPTTADERLVGISAGFNSVCHMVERVAPTRATVLFLGESGVGKDVFARAVHRRSPRTGQAFVALNCASLPEQLVESELFGAERGAYTGAVHSRLGRFERADGGTLFLDEIGTLSASAQAKLLRALQEGEIERLGDTQIRRVDVRVVAATNVDLREEVRSGRFREDLFFRLNVFPIRIPPLRERREDIPLLMNHFLLKFAQRHQRTLTGFTQRAIDAMLTYNWPGNIREMENVIERGVILGTENRAIDVPQLFTSGEQLGDRRYAVSSEGKLVATDPSKFIGDPASDRAVDRVSKRVSNLLLGEGNDIDSVSLDDIETTLLKKAIERARGNVAAAARLLGITRPQMVYRLKTRGIVLDGE